MSDQIACYRYIDVPGTRVHIWGEGPEAKYAKGFGPIVYITKEEAESLIDSVKK
jgi:hypothetical protein